MGMFKVVSAQELYTQHFESLGAAKAHAEKVSVHGDFIITYGGKIIAVYCEAKLVWERSLPIT